MQLAIEYHVKFTCSHRAAVRGGGSSACSSSSATSGLSPQDPANTNRCELVVQFKIVLARWQLPCTYRLVSMYETCMKKKKPYSCFTLAPSPPNEPGIGEEVGVQLCRGLMGLMLGTFSF